MRKQIRRVIIGMVILAAVWGGVRGMLEVPKSISAAADPPWCDLDGDGFCFVFFGLDCDDNDPQTYPGAEERADLKDNNCSGFEDEPPLGFDRVGYTMGGAASSVAWYGDYIYLTAGTTLRVYHAPSGGAPLQIYETELRDWGREMTVDGDTLFVAARGDGLQAFDLSVDPAHPEPAGAVSGVIDVDGYAGVEAIFNGVDAVDKRVAVARVNNVTKTQGGVDALVYDYDPVSDTFTLVSVFGTEVRSKTDKEAPITVGLTEDGAGLYIGYGILVGELVYVPVDSPGEQAIQADIGSPMDIATQGDAAFVALTGLSFEDFSMLSRVTPVGGVLVEDEIVINSGSGAGISVGVDGDLLCFGTWSPGRYEEGYNLWTFRDLDQTMPTRVGNAATPDWIYQLTCREDDSETGWAYVADEWGGLELWASDGISLTLDLDTQRVPSGALSLDIWTDGDRIYTAKEGAGLWTFDDGNLESDRVAVEWIDTTDPGCACEGCCPPEVGLWPYPPAVFIDSGVSNQGVVVVTAQDRNNAVAGDAYLMFFEEDGGEYELIYSDPLGLSDPMGGTWGANMISTEGEIIFVALAAQTMHLYQHCPGDTQQVRPLIEIEHPTTGSGFEFGDVAVYGDYLFISEQYRPWLSEPTSALVHVYRWKTEALALCPDQPVLLDPPEHLGFFTSGVIPYKLLIDPERQRLYVGCTSKITFPVINGEVLSYDLTAFDPVDVPAMDSHVTSLTPDESMRVTYPNVHDLLLDGDDLFILDRDNGLYRYALDEGRIKGFYPAHRGPQTEAYMPSEWVQSPEGVVPLYHPVTLALTPSGTMVVQEHVTGRVSVFRMLESVFLPLIVE